MEEYLNKLRISLKESFILVGGNECSKLIINNQDSLLLAIIESNLKWQKKKTEKLFENGAISGEVIPVEFLNEFVLNKFVAECSKPTLKGNYFITLKGLYFLECKRVLEINDSIIGIL